MIKKILKPTKWKIILFLFLFAVIFFVPYIKVSPDYNKVRDIIMPGRYPIIFMFLISSIIIRDMLSGTFILNDMFVFFGFLLSFLFVYLGSCLIIFLSIERDKTISS